MKLLVLIFSVLISLTSFAKSYNLSINEKMVSFSGEEKEAMAINNSIPGPTLTFIEGETAEINVTNNMDVETSIHWHGLILPNFQDGVPYLTTPPIMPGKTFTYRFPLKHSGTYWYHSHTGLQEQRGVYGSIVINPKLSIVFVLVLVDCDLFTYVEFAIIFNKSLFVKLLKLLIVDVASKFIVLSLVNVFLLFINEEALLFII